MDKSMNKKFEPICVKSEVFAEEIKETTEKNTKLVYILNFYEFFL